MYMIHVHSSCTHDIHHTSYITLYTLYILIYIHICKHVCPHDYIHTISRTLQAPRLRPGAAALAVLPGEDLPARRHRGLQQYGSWSYLEAIGLSLRASFNQFWAMATSYLGQLSFPGNYCSQNGETYKGTGFHLNHNIETRTIAI